MPQTQTDDSTRPDGENTAKLEQQARQLKTLLRVRQVSQIRNEAKLPFQSALLTGFPDRSTWSKYWLFPYMRPSTAKKFSETDYRSKLLLWANLILNVAILELYPNEGTHKPSINWADVPILTPDNFLATMRQYRITWELSANRSQADGRARTIANLRPHERTLLAWFGKNMRLYGKEIQSTNGFEHQIHRSDMSPWQRVFHRAWQTWMECSMSWGMIHQLFSETTEPRRTVKRRIGTESYTVDMKITSHMDWVYDHENDRFDEEATAKLRKTSGMELQSGAAFYVRQFYVRHKCTTECEDINKMLDLMGCPHIDEIMGEIHYCDDRCPPECRLKGKIRPYKKTKMGKYHPANEQRKDDVIVLDNPKYIPEPEPEPKESLKAAIKAKELEFDDLFSQLQKEF